MELKSTASIRTAKHDFPCELCDLSERGARIRFAGQPVPDRFDLVLGNGELPRLAQIRWTKGDETGVEFISRGSGDRIPDVFLATPIGKTVNLRPLVSQRRSVLAGVVGAFAPERFQIHLTEVLTRAEDLYRAGYVRLICAVPNDPWTLKAWSETIDPERRITFLSDGNLDLARWLGATFVTSRRRHLGARSRSYLALIREGVIEKLTIDTVAANLVFDERQQTPENGGDATPS